MRFPLQRSWQDGPAVLEVESDELELDDGLIGVGVVISVESALLVEGATAYVGVLQVDLPDGKAEARITVAASIEQARAVRDYLSEIIRAADEGDT